jgi:hypothetical protein
MKLPIYRSAVEGSTSRRDTRGGDRVRTAAAMGCATKGRYVRRVRHENWGLRHCVLELEASKFQCHDCGRYFRDRFPGIQPCQRSSEAFQRMIFGQHLDEINRSRLGRRKGMGAATVERYFQRGLQRASLASGIPRAVRRCWASTSTSLPAAAATPPRCVT